MTIGREHDRGTLGATACPSDEEMAAYLDDHPADRDVLAPT